MHIIIATSLFVLALGILIWRRVRREPKRLPLPPGPKPLLIIGNLHQLAGSNHWKITHQWHQKYGPLVSFKLGTYTFVSIGSQKVGKELLEKRGSIYSSRPSMRFLREFTSKNLQPALLPYAPQWKLLHRMQSSLLSREAVKAYRPAQELESLQLLHDLLVNSSSRPSRHLYRFGTSLAFRLAFGKRMPNGDEQDVVELAQLVERKVDLFRWVPFLIDAFPFLQHLPEFLSPWRRVASGLHKTEINLMTRIMKEALQRPDWTWTRELTTMKIGEELSWEQYCYLLGELYTAAHLTVTSSLNIFVTIAAKNPSQVRRAQEEIDTTVEAGKIPSFADMESLPFVQAFANEVLRYRPLLPVGVPHSVSKDDEYLGYRIPKDAFIIPHHWSMDLDPDVHKDPTAFRPDRWIEDPKLPLAAFGFGRRSCPGEQMGRSSFGVVVMRCLWAFDFLEGEKEALLTPQGQNIVSLPAPSDVCLRVRGPTQREVIEKSWILAEKDEERVFAEIGRTFSAK